MTVTDNADPALSDTALFTVTVLDVPITYDQSVTTIEGTASRDRLARQFGQCADHLYLFAAESRHVQRHCARFALHAGGWLYRQ